MPSSASRSAYAQAGSTSAGPARRAERVAGPEVAVDQGGRRTVRDQRRQALDHALVDAPVGRRETAARLDDVEQWSQAPLAVEPRPRRQRRVRLQGRAAVGVDRKPERVRRAAVQLREPASERRLVERRALEQLGDEEALPHRDDPGDRKRRARRGQRAQAVGLAREEPVRQPVAPLREEGARGRLDAAGLAERAASERTEAADAQRGVRQRVAQGGFDRRLRARGQAGSAPWAAGWARRACSAVSRFAVQRTSTWYMRSKPSRPP